MCFRPLLVCVMVAACAGLGRAEVIFSNLDPTGDVGPAYLVNSPDAGEVDQAAAFVAPAVPGDPAGTWRLTSADLVFGVDGDQPVTLSLFSDDAGLPGAAIASTQAAGFPAGFADELVNVPFPTMPELTPGNRYWFVLSVEGEPTNDFSQFGRAYWRENSIGQTGDAAVSFDFGATWQLHGSDSETPTLRVNAVVPEPTTAALFVLTGVGLLRRR